MQRKPIRKISKKKKQQLKEERLLVGKLLIKQNGKCADCGGILGWGSAKHEIKFRSKGGDPTSEENCILLCLVCHAKRHHQKFIMEG